MASSTGKFKNRHISYFGHKISWLFICSTRYTCLKDSTVVPIEDIKSSLHTYFAKHSLPDVHINTLDTGSEFFKRIFLRCQKSDSLISLARFSKQTFVNDDKDIDTWVNEYDPHISIIYAEEKDCNDQELINRIDISTLINKAWQGGRIQLVDTSEKLSEWKTVLEFDIPNST